MSAIDVGRVCEKIAGREAGKKCVIVDILDRNFVLIVGENVRRRRVNLNHIKPIDKIIDVSQRSTDEEIIAELKNI